MAELYKNATVASDVLIDKCKRTEAEKDELSKKLRQTEEKLKQAEDQLLDRLSESDQELQQKLHEVEAAIEVATT